MNIIGAAREAQFVYADDLELEIGKTITEAVLTIYNYLLSNEPWECPIGHIVPRVPTWTSYGDASEQCVAFFIKSEKVFCILPFTKALKTRIDNNEVHVNNLEYITLHLAKILVQLLYSQNPSKYPPHPCHNVKGDNTPSVGWLNNTSTASTLGQQQLQLTAEYTLLADIKSTASHIDGKSNDPADSFSRPYKCFPKPYPLLWDIPYNQIIKQVCTKHPRIKSWRIFLPSREVISSLNATLSNNVVWERPIKPTNRGQLLRVESILSTGAQCEESSMRYFL